MRPKDITETKNQLDVLGLITRAYSETASTGMKKTKEGVLQNRLFITDLSKIFEDVRAEYASGHVRESKSGRKLTFLAHNGKTVSVLLSSESGLYGSVVGETFELFKNEVRENRTEVTIAENGVR